MKDVILIITEGLKPEHNRLKEIENIFLNKKRNIVLSPDVGHIINLINALDEDPYLDYLTWLKENKNTNEIIDNLSLDDISETYLFFDYDCQSILKTGFNGGSIDKYNEKLLHLLTICNESTNPLGKLFISYPMIESLWDIPKNSDFKNCNNNCFVSIHSLANYKQLITNKNNDRCARNMNKELWQKYLSIHLDRFLRFIGFNDFENLKELSYTEIIVYDLIKAHKIQSKLSEEKGLVFATNPLPLFLLEIGGEKQFKIFAIDLKNINCKCEANSKLHNLI